MQLTAKPSHSQPLFTSKTIWNIVFLILAFWLAKANASESEETEPASKISNAELEKLDVNELKMTVLTDISSTIISDGELASSIKTSIASLVISPLMHTPEVQVAGSDEFTRPIAVSFQKTFEQSLMNMLDEALLSHATAIIHTRKPTTPLCNPVGKALRQTMSASMQDDPHRVKTIQDRTFTLRRMAQKGSPVELYVAYTKGGLDKRSPEEQQIYKKEVNNTANSSLRDKEMTCTEMPDEIVGASYLLTTKRGNTLFFSTNGTQAADAAGSIVWRFWFGSLKDASVEKRYKEVIKYLKEGGLDIPVK
ncbi:hypothetical protein [Endozoicomonas sp. 2B-B]